MVKRRTERIKSHLNISPSGSQATKVLHEADDFETLYRIMGSLYLWPNSAAVAANAQMLCKCVLAIFPNGTNVQDTLVFSEVLDTDVPLQYIAEFDLEATIDGSKRKQFGTKWDFDIKAMRKMNKDDQVVLIFLGEATDYNFFLRGPINLWFKQA